MTNAQHLSYFKNNGSHHLYKRFRHDDVASCHDDKASCHDDEALCNDDKAFCNDDFYRFKAAFSLNKHGYTNIRIQNIRAPEGKYPNPRIDF